MTAERFSNALLQRLGISNVMFLDLELELDNICRSVSFPRVSSKVYAVGGGESHSEANQKPIRRQHFSVTANQKAVFLGDSKSEPGIAQVTGCSSGLSGGSCCCSWVSWPRAR